MAFPERCQQVAEFDSQKAFQRIFAQFVISSELSDRGETFLAGEALEAAEIFFEHALALTRLQASGECKVKPREKEAIPNSKEEVPDSRLQFLLLSVTKTASISGSPPLGPLRLPPSESLTLFPEVSAAWTTHSQGMNCLLGVIALEISFEEAETTFGTNILCEIWN